ncbi:flavodoxin family protein [Zooshikella marina]|uniref:flavodoxin family protein n=1 Tax=Zooshikella ganghwensis TaxID=202772 RepID=UPI001BAEBEF9|nr:flavodoxin family protein [Zooshikella ganghwensis]MBU2705664.1 flavodoxin family protein [Zooshikella ganghwensis]
MSKIAIVYHSGFGHTEVQAKAVVSGVTSVNGVSADLFEVALVTDNPEQLNAYNAIIFGAPTYMGSLSAPFKAFMDASSKVWFNQGWKDKLAAGFTNSGSMSGDKFNSLVQLTTFAAQHSMLWVSLGQMNESSSPDIASGHPEAVNRIGAYLSAMAQSDNLPADQTPPSGDLKTAEQLGKRVAEASLRWQ